VDRYATPLLQQGLNDCGVAVARELGRRQARPVSDAALQAALPLTPWGITLDSLAAGLGALGHPGTVLRHAWQLPLQPLDVLLLRSHHFVLLLDASPDHVRYYDPMVGMVRRTRDAFRQDWTGKLIRQRPRRRRSPPFPQDPPMRTSNSVPMHRTARTARTTLGALSAALLLTASVSASAPRASEAWHGTATTAAETGGGPGLKCLGCVSAGVAAVWAFGPSALITTLIVGGAPAVAVGGYVAGCAAACVSFFRN
jgi:ABC-type bacteriocin/lantibiotic exporter with double-glycine peptidase domain